MTGIPFGTGYGSGLPGRAGGGNNVSSSLVDPLEACCKSKAGGQFRGKEEVLLVPSCFILRRNCSSWLCGMLSSIFLLLVLEYHHSTRKGRPELILK